MPSTRRHIFWGNKKKGGFPVKFLHRKTPLSLSHIKLFMRAGHLSASADKFHFGARVSNRVGKFYFPTRGAGRVLRQQLFSIRARAHKKGGFEPFVQRPPCLLQFAIMHQEMRFVKT